MTYKCQRQEKVCFLKSCHISILAYGAGTSIWAKANTSNLIQAEMKISLKYRKKNQQRQNNTPKNYIKLKYKYFPDKSMTELHGMQTV
jgi:hypothetical protein